MITVMEFSRFCDGRVCIVELNLKDNLLTELPDTICKMKWLSILDVSHNKIMLFPKNWDNIRLDHNIG